MQLVTRSKQVLSRLRGAVRRYVWLEWMARSILIAAALYWLLVGIDWLWEPERTLRLLLLAAAGGVLLVVLYRVLLRRIFAKFSDRNMAMLLERRFNVFQDGLLTSVDYAERTAETTDYERAMLNNTVESAASQAGDIRIADVLQYRPLVRKWVWAGLAALSVGAFALWSPEQFEFSVQRLTALTDELWPRKTRLEIDGFENGEIVVARGSNLVITVRADTGMEVPQVVQIRYRTDEGVSRRQNMTKEGNAEAGVDPFQDFRHVFEGVLSPLTFDVLGGDARLRDLRVRVVESPTLSEVRLVCKFPEYMHREPRELTVSGIVQLPLGSKVTVLAKANKPLVEAAVDYPQGKDSFGTWIINAANGLHTPQDSSPAESSPEEGSTFSFEWESLETDTTFQVRLKDMDGIVSRTGLPIGLAVIPDLPPQVGLRLSGISNVLTPQAMIPIAGTATDDYGIAGVDLSVTIDTNELPRQNMLSAAAALRPEVEVNHTIDLAELDLSIGQTVSLAALVTDDFSLPKTPQPHVTRREFNPLRLVSPQELRAILEGREIDQRLLLEAVLAEVTESRELLDRIELTAAEAGPPAEQAKPTDGANGTNAGGTPTDGTATEGTATEGKTAEDKGAKSATESDPEATGAPATDPPVDPVRQKQARQERNLIRGERSLQNVLKNSQELLAIARAIDGILEELHNNRLDSQELQERLKGRIADPLKDMSQKGFVELEKELRNLKELLEDPDRATASRQLAKEAFDRLIARLEKVRDEMKALETFKEAVDLLKEIVNEQQRLNELTKKRRSAGLDLEEDEP